MLSRLRAEPLGACTPAGSNGPGGISVSRLEPQVGFTHHAGGDDAKLVHLQPAPLQPPVNPRALACALAIACLLLACLPPGAVAAPSKQVEASITVTRIGDGVLVEGEPASGDDAFEVVLRDPIGSPVTITPVAHQVEVIGGPVTFTPDDWDIPRKLGVRAAADRAAEGSHLGTVAFTVGEFGSVRDAGVAPLLWNIADDDVASLDCVPGPGWDVDAEGRVRITEGGRPATCRLTPGAAPMSDVAVLLHVAATGALQVPQRVVIPAGSVEPVDVTITAPEDAIDDDGPVELAWSVITTDPAYGAVGMAATRFSIGDDDIAGVVPSATTVDVTEGGAGASVEVRLASQPTGVVELLPRTDMPSATNAQQQQLHAVGVAALQFSPTDWNVPRTVTVSAVNDDIVEGAHSGFVRFTATGAGYEQVESVAVLARIADDDAPSLHVELPTGGVHAAEGGGAGLVQVKLGSRPAADVVVDVTTDAQGIASPGRIRFTPEDWRMPKEVRIGAVQDVDVEGAHTTTARLAISSDDPAYAPAVVPPIAPIAVAITDDDIPGVSVLTSGVDTIVREGGAGDEYSIVLSARPLADVRVAIARNEDLVFSGDSLTFTPTNWSIPQVVSVQAADDRADERDTENVAVIHAATSDHPAWAGVQAPGLRVAVLDDDLPPPDGPQSERDPFHDTPGGGGGDEDGRAVQPRIAPDLHSGVTPTRVSPIAASVSHRSTVDAPEAGATASDADPLVAAPASSTDAEAGRHGVLVGSGGGEPGAAPEKQAPKSEKPEGPGWIARHWRQAAPVAVAALGLGGSIMFLMSDPFGAGIRGRRLW